MDTYIINPWVIYLIEQLRSINTLFGITFIISGILWLWSFFKLYYIVFNNGYEYIKEEGILRSYGMIESTNEEIKQHIKNLDETFNNNEHKCVDQYKVNDLFSRLNNSFDSFDKLSKHIDEKYNSFNKYKLMTKWSCIIMIISLLAIIFIPTKESAYKILMSTYLTQENITDAGNITTDIANSIVDKITDSIIKIKEAGK